MAQVAFLQQNVDDQGKTVGNYKAGNVEMIRQMLREQQRSMGALHQNALCELLAGIIFCFTYKCSSRCHNSDCFILHLLQFANSVART